MSDVSTVTNLIPTVNEGFATTLGSGIAAGAATVPLSNVAGLTDATVFVGIIEPGVASKQQTLTGVVDLANSRLTSVKWTRPAVGGSNETHAAGVTIVDYVTGTHFNLLAKAVRTHTAQNGSLLPAAVQTAIGNGGIVSTNLALSRTVDANGWTVYDFGTFKQYRKRGNNSLTAGALAWGSTPGFSPWPVGFSTIPATHFIDSSAACADAAITINTRPIPTDGSLTFQYQNRFNGSITSDVYWSITITAP